MPDELTMARTTLLDPDVLSADPLVNHAMRDAGFEPDPRSSAVGTWISRRGVPVDLMVPDAVAGAGRRGVRVPPMIPRQCDGRAASKRHLSTTHRS